MQVAGGTISRYPEYRRQEMGPGSNIPLGISIGSKDMFHIMNPGSFIEMSQETSTIPLLYF